MKDKKRLKKQLTDVLHSWIKHQYAIDEYCRCFTCDKCLPLGSPFLHGGHFIPKSVAPGLRFIQDNIRPQCQQCNFNDGEREKFESRLRDEIGNERVDWLLDNRYLAESKHPAEWYFEQIQHYKNLDSVHF